MGRLLILGVSVKMGGYMEGFTHETKLEFRRPALSGDTLHGVSLEPIEGIKDALMTYNSWKQRRSSTSRVEGHTKDDTINYLTYQSTQHRLPTR